MNNDVMFSSKSDEWYTPQDLSTGCTLSSTFRLMRRRLRQTRNALRGMALVGRMDGNAALTR